MKPEKDPVVIDLAAKRKAAEQAKAAARKKPVVPGASKEPLLGRNRNARLIVALVAAAALVLWLAPLILR